MEALWREMGRSWPVAAPHALFTERLGTTAVDTLRHLGLLRREPLRDGDRYPCDGCSRGREVVIDQGAWAVCTCHPTWCEPIELSVAELLSLDPQKLVTWLRQLFSLSGPSQPPTWNGIGLLGERQIGFERLQFAFVPRPSTLNPAQLSRWLTDHRSTLTVLLAPHREALPTASALPSDPPFCWLTLSDVVDTQSGTVDLSELLLRYPIPGADLGALLYPRFALVLTHDQIHYAGQPLTLDRRPLVADFLRLLADQPNRFICRRDLMLNLYPDEITNRGRILAEPFILERRIRQLASDLGKVFAEVDPHDLPANPIENLRSRSDLEGGYRLALPPEEVFIHRCRPPPNPL
jgi:hypothetical protein